MTRVTVDGYKGSWNPNSYSFKNKNENKEFYISFSVQKKCVFSLNVNRSTYIGNESINDVNEYIYYPNK